MARARLHSLVVLTLVAGLLAACSGEESNSRAPKGSADNPLVAEPTPATRADRGTEESSRRSRKTAGNEPAGRSNEASGTFGETGGSAPQPGYQELVDRQSRRPRGRFTPCNLVTKTQAREIVGTPIQEPLEAPQGPTCIYRTQTGDGFVTLAVQTVDFRELKPQLQQPQRVAVSDRTAYCGQYGQAMLYLPLSRGRVLTVSGPCRVAKQFAATALRQLST